MNINTYIWTDKVNFKFYFTLCLKSEVFEYTPLSKMPRKWVCCSLMFWEYFCLIKSTIMSMYFVPKLLGSPERRLKTSWQKWLRSISLISKSIHSLSLTFSWIAFAKNVVSPVMSRAARTAQTRRLKWQSTSSSPSMHSTLKEQKKSFRKSFV